MEKCCSHPGRAGLYGLGPSLPAYDEHGPCAECGSPVMSDDSFFQQGGVYLHQNNAVPTCQAKYAANPPAVAA